MYRIIRHGKRVGIAIIGGIVIVVGIVLIPYPGPGWLVVFAGLAILATEFEFAENLLKQLKETYQSWEEWLKRQPKILQVLTLCFTGLVVLATIWLLNTFGLIDTFFHLHQQWLHSPLFRN